MKPRLRFTADGLLSPFHARCPRSLALHCWYAQKSRESTGTWLQTGLRCSTNCEVAHGYRPAVCVPAPEPSDPGPLS